jgi:hypothetical protein
MLIDLEEQREKLIHRYRLVIEKSRRHWQAVNEPMTYQMFDPEKAIDYDKQYQRKPLNKVYVTDRDLERMFQDLTRLEIVHEENYFYKDMQLQQERERKLRESTPALKKAWETYQTLLRLSK